MAKRMIEIVLSVTTRVAELGQSQFKVHGIDNLRAHAKMDVSTKLGRKKAGTVRLVCQCKSKSGKDLTLVIGDAHCLWIPHQSATEQKALEGVWNGLAKDASAGVTLQVLSCEVVSNDSGMSDSGSGVTELDF